MLLIWGFNDASAQNQGNGKKVYADYHGTRYTREHDGMLGRWSFYDNTEQSSTPIKSLAYNADIILENGHNDIAAVAFPMAGIQSALDPDFIEYEILTAKAAKIDGFFIEWGFPEHESTLLLEAMQNVALKYDFEIGVNWCDGWLYYDWITKHKPHIKTRFDKTQHFKHSFQYLIDHVFSSSTSPIVQGKPVFYLFGGGITPTEYQSVIDKNNFTLPEGTEFPEVLRRIAEWGKIVEDKYVPASMGSETKEWEALEMTPTAWIPARVRPMDDQYPLWDQYAILDDVIAYMKPFKTKIWESDNPIYSLKSGFVTPGMDNRGCAGWGRGHFFLIPREDGRTYEEMWKFNLSAKDSLDMVFIASWSDYTEGHEIEPTIENGYRELETTLKYAAEFKEESIDDSGMALPLRLFHLRKKEDFFKNVGIQHTPLQPSLDAVAIDISNGQYAKAAQALDRLDKVANEIERNIKTTSHSADKKLKVNGKKQKGTYAIGSDVYVEVGEKIVDKLQKHHYTGYVTFEYLDEGVLQKFELVSKTKRSPESKFSVVAEVRTNGTNEWKKAKVKLIDRNIALQENFPNGANFKFKGKGKIRNIKFDFKIHQ